MNVNKKGGGKMTLLYLRGKNYFYVATGTGFLRREE